jgi:hypothetical protein
MSKFEDWPIDRLTEMLRDSAVAMGRCNTVEDVRIAISRKFRQLCDASRREAEQLTNISGLSKHFHLPKNWIKAEADSGRIPCLRVGKRYLFNITAVAAALAKRAASNDRGQSTMRGNVSSTGEGANDHA